MRGSGSSSAGRGRGRDTGQGRGRGRGRGDPEQDPLESSDPGAEQQVLAGRPAPRRAARQPQDQPPATDETGRIRVTPDAGRERLLDSRNDSGSASRAILPIFRSSWFPEGSSWKKLTAEHKDFYFEEFKKGFCWDSTHPEDLIRGVFYRHAANRYKDTLHNMKPDKKEGSVSADTWASWKRDWDTAEAKKKSEVARANRLSEPSGAGTGPVRHTAGSRSATRHKTVMTEELGREPTLAELHVRLHLTKADRTVFVDKRSKDKNDRFQAELAAATQSQAAGEGSSSTPEPIDENELFLSLEAIKKQRVYGIGSASASYIGQSSRLRRGGSSQSQQQAVVSEEIEQRIAREVEERLEQRMRTVEAGFEERVEQRIRTVEAGFDERIRTELARLMTTLPPELRPQFPPPPPPPADDTTSLE
ncbi:uncharacterized protein LOC126668119 [Mercurialis annua]|uniref:uncharacterized protein LOC126661987 n=1 Tax=Mercurialis annua TaxID=3986 RepID=UPI00215DF322|nr:uncharacterized protein LOC126661987 [Mercurialis annua]XP_050217292.1 uncharacterized protein LOC126668119 [Mercurialis annua]